MAVEQRILGSTLLVLGIVVVLGLIAFFGLGGGPTPNEALEQIKNELLPRYDEALRREEFLQAADAAREIRALIREAGSVGVNKLVTAEATTDRGEALRLQRLIESKTFEKNSEGLFEFESKWYESTSYRELLRLRATVDDEIIQSLKEARAAARQLAAAVQEARLGSSKPLLFPDPKLPEYVDEALQGDADLFRAFGVQASALRAALATPDPGPGRAKSARLRWNQKIVSSDLAANLGKVGGYAESLKLAALELNRISGEVASDPTARPALAKYLAKTVTALLPGAAPARKKSFENPTRISELLSGEHKILDEHLGGLTELLQTVSMNFK